MTAPSTPTSTMKPCPFCGGSLTHHPATRWGDDYYQHERDDCVLAGGEVGDPLTVFDSAEQMAAWNRRSPVEAQPCAVAGEAVQALEKCRNALLALGVGSGSQMARDAIDAANAVLAAPSAVLPLKGEVPTIHAQTFDLTPEQRDSLTAKGVSHIPGRGEGAAASSVPKPEAWLCGGSLFHSYAAIPGNLLPPVGSPVPLYARPLPGGVPTGLPTEAIEDAASVLRHIGPQLNAEWAHRCARAAAALSAGAPSSLQGERK